MMETTVLWCWVSTRAAYSGPDPASGVITMENAVPRLAPGGGVTGVISVCPAGTDTSWLALGLGLGLAEPAEASSVRRTRTAAAGADSTTEAAKPDPLGLPAMTACSLPGPG